MPEVARRPRVGLFATCLMNVFRPQLGMASVKLLEASGCEVAVPAMQTCCGQPGYNSGDFHASAELGKQFIETFEGFDYVVAPSGSCIATVRHDYPQLLADDPAWKSRAEALAKRSHELLGFLHDVRGYIPESLHFHTTATYHDGCSGLRALGIKGQPRKLLARIEGLRLKEMAETEVCCGFGGTFCIKYPEISAKLVDDKIQHALATDAEVLTGGELGCLMHIAGRLRRIHAPIRVYHAAEILAGTIDDDGIAGSDQPR